MTDFKQFNVWYYDFTYNDKREDLYQARRCARIRSHARARLREIAR